MTIFQCSKCNKSFTRKLHLDNHLNRKTTCIKTETKIIYSDIENSPKIYLKIIEHLINNKWVDYIFPYRFDEDKDNYINLLNS